jgi:UDP-N-acetylglucosamine 1-carboxyvinyltransferase
MIRVSSGTKYSDRALVVQGGTALTGVVEVSGAKNAALPLLAASLLTRDPVTLHRVPRIADVEVLLDILGHLGTRWNWSGPSTITLHTPELISIAPPPALVLRMRASFELLGPILGREGEAELTLPGGCRLGPRPVDQHVRVLRGIGVSVTEIEGSITAAYRRPLAGNVRFDIRTVGGTRNAIMASTLNSTEVTLENASTEPEVLALIGFLNHLGARIAVAGDTITVQGIGSLSGGEYEVIPDRMEAGTYLLAAAATRGLVTVCGVEPAHLAPVVELLRNTGVLVQALDPVTLQVDARSTELKPMEVIVQPHPGYPTDLHPQTTAFLSTVAGKSHIVDTVFPLRTAYLPELSQLGCRLDWEGERADIRIEGGPLQGGAAHVTDLRAGGALVIAALSAPQDSVLTGIEHIERGYQDLQRKLGFLGATVSLKG